MSKPQKRSRHDRTLEEKLKILQYVDENPGMKKKNIAAHFGMKPQTLSDLVKNSDEIRAQSSEGSSLASSKRKRASTHPEVDEALLIWFRQKSCRAGLHFDGYMLLQQANKFLKGLSVDTEQTISMPWVDRWKKRHGVSRITKAGESGGVEIEIVREWKEGKLQEILSTYRPNDIYNADETGLFWLLLPDNSLGLIEQAHHGAKQAESRITVLVGANMTGTDKLPLLVIGKSKNPRAFRNVTVPVEYRANNKAWMTSILFENWLSDLDKRMRREKRKIAMIIDHCPVHPNVELTNIDLLFLPPNTASHTQPMDSGIIKNLKLHYRHSLALRRLEAAEDDAPPFTWNLLDSVVALKSAWKRVKVQTVADCFKKAGFIVDQARLSSENQPEEAATSAENPEPMEEVSLRNIWDRLRQIYGDSVPNDMNAYVSVDDEIETSPHLNDEQIVQAVVDPVVEREIGSDEEEESETQATAEEPVPKLNDAYAAMRTLRRYGLGCSCPDMEDIIFQIEGLLMNQSQKSLTKTADFFVVK